ncbi:cyanophycin metabolism-associated DUF1854 family protein [Paludibaculum fermentans]|uniref:DUF1854 domain-containing protein n=1 Tax=Paludibaculum fermentans TaxID=1473598 RepID=A0A7S7SJG0_PALFE|nr:DUF1854 domain-containing protein [Paludibaculum fermentans]QOY86421.1 DUF1854 domain-containing protein [Paludibaculum fermentans]
MSFHLERDNFGRLVLIDAAGVRHVDVSPVQAFPLSEPGRHISILDAGGRELVSLDSLAGLDPRVRATLEAELAERMFVPEIVKIVNTPSEMEPSTWTVETDRGVVTFTVEGEDSIHLRDRGRVSIVDSHGIRYEIRDARKLDAHSRRVLEPYL